MSRLICGLLLLALSGPGASAYVRQPMTGSDPTPISWDFAGTEPELIGGRLTFRLNPLGSADVLDGSDLLAIESAFQRWEELSDTAVAFSRGSDFSGEVVANDNVLPVFWVEDSAIVDQDTPDPSDDIDIGTALAVTFTMWFTSGPSAGRIIDTNIVFNGFEHEWTTDPDSRADRFDIESVAVHEIGHGLGIGHSAVGGATMFPRTAPGRAHARSPSSDDRAAAGEAYGTGSWPPATARLSGIVRQGGTPLFGAHVVAEDAHGNAVAAAITRNDGSYEIDGLPAGSLTVWAEPLDVHDGSSVLFNERNLPGHWRGGVIDLDFRTSPGEIVVTSAGNVSVLDFDLPPGSPTLDITLVGATGGSFLANSPAAVEQGAKDVQVRVGAPVGQIPDSGTPLSISGGGFTLKDTSFQLLNGNTIQAISLTVDVDPDAVPGLRSLIITEGGERTVASGHLEVLSVAPAADADGDTVPDGADNCPATANAGQQDADSDGAGDACDPCPNDPADDADLDGLCADADNCPDASNAGQQDADADGAGDACDACPNDAANDEDADGRCAGADNCPAIPNSGQQDADADGAGDACDPCPNDAEDDAEGDGACADVDNCPSLPNPGQEDGDADGTGDACDPCPDDPADDGDVDGHCADADNCPSATNPGQEDGDLDGLGDACDACPSDAANDADSDGLCADVDNCPVHANPAQQDGDADGSGDACDACPEDPGDDGDGDGHCAGADNCPAAPNPAQDDGDQDGAGDACDPCPLDASNDADGDSVCGDLDNCPLVANAAQVDADDDGRGDACDLCPDDSADRCVTVNLMRQADATERSAAAVQAVFGLGENGGLDPATDIVIGNIAGMPSLSISGDGAPVGAGNPGVLIFYDVQNAAGLLSVRRSGTSVVLSGW
jgi:hypothetical protein